jgi:hypothetical protein
MTINSNLKNLIYFSDFNVSLTVSKNNKNANYKNINIILIILSFNKLVSKQELSL